MKEIPPRPDMTLDEDLTQTIREMKTGRSRFRFPLRDIDAYRLLMSCYTAEVEYRSQECKLSEFTLDKIWQFAVYITSQPPKIGAIMCGKAGNGKTTLVYAFQRALNYLNDLSLFTDAAGDVIRRQIEIYTAKDLNQIAKSDWKRFESIRDLPMLALDELGEEPRLVKDYGNDISPIIDLLECRYNMQLFTLITTNLLPNQIEQEYGPRIADRFREMLTVINFGNEKSFRR